MSLLGVKPSGQQRALLTKASSHKRVNVSFSRVAGQTSGMMFVHKLLHVF